MVLSCLRSAEGRIRRGEPLISTPALLSPIVQCTQACLHARAHCVGWSHAASEFHSRIEFENSPAFQRWGFVKMSGQALPGMKEPSVVPSGLSYLPSRIPVLKRWAIFGFEEPPSCLPPWRTSDANFLSNFTGRPPYTFL